MRSFKIPGTDSRIEYVTNSRAELQSLTVDRRTYVERRGEDLVFQGDWIRVSEKQIGRTLLRQVNTADSNWVESYVWDQDGLLHMVDGTHIERDENGAIVRCSGQNQTWRYHYENHQLVQIESPHDRRKLIVSGDRRPVGRESCKGTLHFHYDANGQRQDTPEPSASWHRDEFGRLWTVTDAQGRITATYLWWGFACLARIDGPPGADLAAVFSLDPSGTPVRMTTPNQSRRFMRDAFGESLLGIQGVPGLFGGAQSGDFVHYRSRVLDPKVGSFTAPDPWHGGAEDPRRANGFRGVLPVEMPPAGPYCVCQHDPVARMDPTGEISTETSAGLGTFFGTLSSLTWGFQNNLTGITLLGFWNIVLSLLSFNGKQIKRIGDVEGMRSPYTGAWGVRAHPSGLELLGINRHRAWTVQHIIWARGEEFDELARARVFVPDHTFKPKLDGSVLWVKPAHGHENTDPGIGFVLCGNRRNGAPASQVNGFATGWTRSGGIGEPVFEGSATPWFPEGGLHFAYQKHVPTPVKGTIAEVHPTGEIYQGLIRSRLTIRAKDLSKKPSKGQVVMATRDKNVVLHTVRGLFTEGAYTHILVEDTPATLEHITADLHEVTLDANKETLQPGTTTQRLDGKKANANHNYRVDQYLRLEGGSPDKKVAGTRITALEVKVTLDDNLPTTSGSAPYRVYLVGKLVNKGLVDVNSKTELKFPANLPKPDPDDYIVLKLGSTEGIYKVSAGGDAQTFNSDRDMLAAFVSNKVKWYIAKRETVLGEWNGSGSGMDLIYVPEESGKAPADGAILIKNDDNDILAPRNITALVTDEIILGKPLPGGSNPHEATVIEKGKCLESDAYIQDRTVLFVDEPKPRREALAKSPALHLLRVSDTAIASGTSSAVTNGQEMISNQGWSGGKLEITSFTSTQFPHALAGSHAPMPGQLVVLREHGTTNIELTIVKTLELAVTLAHGPAFPTGTTPPANDWRILPLIEEGLYFQAERKGNLEALLAPKAYRMSAPNTFDTSGAGIGTEDVWFPRFKTGEMVRAVWEVGGVTSTGLYRIDKAHGGHIALEGHPNLPASPNHLAFCKMVPASPDNGTHVSGNMGKRLAPDRFQFSVWHPNGLPDNSYALLHGKQSWAVEITQRDRLLIDFYKAPAMAGTNADIIIPERDDLPLYSGYHKVFEDEWFFPENHLLPGPNRVLIQGYAEPKPADKKPGEISCGTVGIPSDDSDKEELDRRQSLETHELQHTAQFLMQGPVVFGMIPLFLFDVIALATGEGLETPEYSAFVDAGLTTVGRSRFLTIPNTGGIEFAKGRVVQMVQNANTATGRLGDFSNDSFQIWGTAPLSDGQVAVRLKRKDSTEKLSKAYAGLELLTTGGLQETIIGPLVNLLPWGVAQAIHACQKNPRGRFLQPDLFPGMVPDAGNPFVIQVPPKDGDAHGLEVHDKVEILADGVRDTHVVVAVDGQTVTLDTPTRYEGQNRDLQVGKIGEHHPMRFVSNFLGDQLGTRNLRWFFDPFGQLFFEKDPNNKGSLDWALAFLRPFYSTTSWSGVGLLGGFWLDIVYTTAFGEDYYSFMEQGASETSGDLYSPVGRLRGDLEYVGDLGRYFYYHDTRNATGVRLQILRTGDKEIRFIDSGPGGSRRIETIGYRVGDEVTIAWTDGASLKTQFFEITRIEKNLTPATLTISLNTIPGLDSIGGIPSGMAPYFIISPHFMDYEDGEIMPQNQGDAPGVHRDDYLRTMPLRSAPGAPPSPLPSPPVDEPNLAAASPAVSSQAIPHGLYAKNFQQPLRPALADPDSYRPSSLGFVPGSSALQRSHGMYVSFSQPSNDPHRLTTANRTDRQRNLRRGRQAHKVCGTTRQTLYFDQQVKDVKLLHADKELTGSIDLVFCQKANIRIEPDKNRNYELTVLDPENDKVARGAGATYIIAQKTTGTTLAEIARIYDGKSPPTHLNQPFSVPVRALTINVKDTIELREEPDPNAAVVNRNAKPGDKFYMLVPAKLKEADLKKVQTINHSKSPVNGAEPTDSGMIPMKKKDLKKHVIDYIGSGKVYEIHFREDNPPEEKATYSWDVQVEAGQTYAPKTFDAVLKSEIKVEPHFRLESTPDPGKFTTLEGEGFSIKLKPEPNTIELDDEVIITSPNKNIVNPARRFEATVKDGGKLLEVVATEFITTGIYEVLVRNKADKNQKARRTIEII